MVALYELRCKWCKRQLALKLEGRAEIMCPRCKRVNTFNTRDLTKSPAGSRMQPVKEAAG